ncbi:MAG TPA: hypothetical protein VGA61_11045 [Anaerolineae bacterium]
MKRYRQIILSAAPLLITVLLAAALRLWQLPVLPPGLSYDEAVNGVDAATVLGGGSFPIYFLANNGREPLFIYLQVPAIALLGFHPYSLRLVAALIGIVTVPLIYAAGRALLPPVRSDADEPEGQVSFRWPALLAAGGLAVSYWHVSLSRLGLRAILLPPLSILLRLAFWRGWSRGDRRAYAAAGLWLALALYTYTAARLLPLVLAAFVLSEAIVDLWRGRAGDAGHARVLRAAWRQRLIGLALAAAVCILLLAPLAIAALRNPFILSGRSDQVSILAGPAPATALLDNAVRVARNFYDHGSDDLHLNLPGRPANDPLLAVLFTIGWLAALRWLREPRYRLCLLWFGVMLLPTLLSSEAPHPLRGVGALPPLALLYGAGAQAAFGWLRAPAWRARGLAGLTALVVLVGGVWTATGYFGRWPASRRLGEAFNVQDQLAADAAAQSVRRGDGQVPVLLSHALFVRPQVAFALGGAAAAAGAGRAALLAPGATVQALAEAGFDPGQALDLVWREDGGLKVAPVQPLTGPDGEAFRDKGPAWSTLQAPLHRSGWPQLWTRALALSETLRSRAIATPLDVTFADGLRLAGYDVQPAQQPAGTGGTGFRVTLFWDVTPATRHADLADTEVFLHLRRDEAVWATSNGRFAEAYRAVWPGMSGRIQDVRLITAPPDLPPGKAFFEVGLDRMAPSPTTGDRPRVDVIDGTGRPAGDRVDLGAVMVRAAPPQADLSGLRPLDGAFTGGIRLVGYAAAAVPGKPDTLEVSLGWRAESRPPADYTAFLHLIDGGGQILAQHDAPPGGPGNPTTRWVPGETIRSVFRLTLPAGLRLADCRLRAGLYEPVSGRQLPVTTGASAAAGFLILPAGG